MSERTGHTTPIASTRPDIISDRFLRTLRERGAVQAFLFGSVARGEERPDSDLDLFVRFDRDVSFGERLLLEEALEDMCGRHVALIVDIHPAFAPHIIPSLVPLPL